jgi:RNA polymerase primary sigma factor
MSLDTREKVERVVEALADDFHRQGGVRESDLLRLVDKHGLDAQEQVAVVVELRAQGISVEEDPESEDVAPASARTAGSAASFGLFGMSHSLLSHDELLALVRQMRQGETAERALASDASREDLSAIASCGAAAKQRIVESNYRFVVSIAREYQHVSDLELTDLIQEGALGLIRAAELFDHRLGFRFTTYAGWWVRQSVIRAIQNFSRTIRLPSHVHDKLVKVRRVRVALWQEFAREPRAAEIAEQLGWSAEDVQFLLDVGRSVISLNQPAGPDTELEMIDFVSDPFGTAYDCLFHAELEAAIEAAVENLPKRDRLIITRRFGLEDGNPRTLEEIGRELGVSRERVRQLQNRAFERLARDPVLREFSGLKSLALAA